MTKNREGVIKFQLDFKEGPAPERKLLFELDEWRATFRELGLLGQDPDRYEGLGFGNLSRRFPGEGNDAFIISGTQTGQLEELAPEDYATVTSCQPLANSLSAFGRVKPSSEALSHASLYQVSQKILWVMHLHSPDIFTRYQKMNLPFTDPAAEYGTPAMALEIKRLAVKHDFLQPGMIVMAGHQDGILAFGNDAEATGKLVLETLESATKLS